MIYILCDYKTNIATQQSYLRPKACQAATVKGLPLRSESVKTVVSTITDKITCVQLLKRKLFTV